MYTYSQPKRKNDYCLYVLRWKLPNVNAKKFKHILFSQLFIWDKFGDLSDQLRSPCLWNEWKGILIFVMKNQTCKNNRNTPYLHFLLSGCH